MAGTGKTTAQTAGATIKQKIAGAFELFFLFGKGITPFEKENSKHYALRSLILPIAVIPLDFYAAYVHPAPGLEEKPYSTVAGIVGGHIILSFILGTALGYLFCWAFDRRERFWLWFNTGNWMTVPVTAVSIPILLLAVFGNHDAGDIERALTIVLYYGVLVNACVAWKSFKVDWTLAGFFACMSIFVAQQVWNFMFWVNDVPIKWYG